MQKSLLIFFLLFALNVLAADSGLALSPRFPGKVTCFNGKIDHATFCSATMAKMSKPDPNARLLYQGMTCGHPGQVSELQWEFKGSSDDADVYDFTRRFPVDAQQSTSITKRIKFDGKRTIVFEDQYQVIVIEADAKAKK